MIRSVLLILLFFTYSETLLASATSKQSQYLWKLFNGTNVDESSTTFLKIDTAVQNNDLTGAARMATQAPESSFAQSLVKQIFTPIAGREVNYTEPTGDFVLSWMMGALLDTPVKTLMLTDVRYSIGNSRTYTDMIEAHRDPLATAVSDPQLLALLNSQIISDKKQDYISTADAKLGVLTSIQYGNSIFNGGTNRRPIKKLAEDFLCVPNIEKIMNFAINDEWVGQDIPRNPGQNTKDYLNRCVGCHAGMDSLRGAFSGYDFINDSLTWTKKITRKMNNNTDTFPDGYQVRTHDWEHKGWLPIAPDQVNQKFSGSKKLIEMVVASPLFYKCLVQRTKNIMCPSSENNEVQFEQISYEFQKKQLLRDMFISVATKVCMEN